MIRNLCFAFLFAVSAGHFAIADDSDLLSAIRARQLYFDGQPALAFAALLPLAQAGDRQAEATLGFFYATGVGTPIDEAKALALLERAAAKDHPGALYNLARSHELGLLGLQQDPALAQVLYLRAVALDHTPSLHRLGLMYLSGKQITRDTGLGRALLERAVAAGDPQATADLARKLYAGSDLPQDLPRARALFLIAAAHDIAPAQRDYGVMLALGKGGPVEPVQAEYWLRRAQKAGVTEAGFDLARLLSTHTDLWGDRQVEAYAWCLWSEGSPSDVTAENPGRFCTWARTGLGQKDMQAGIDMAKTF